MKIESEGFQTSDLIGFLDEILVYDVRSTAERLRRAGRRIRELSLLVDEDAVGAESWSAKEIFAHLAVVSRAYGVFAYMVATERMTEMNFTQVITQRDVLGSELAQRSVAELLDEIESQHARTLKFLETATIEQLKRSCKVEYGSVTAESLIRLPLVAHLEQHIDQLEKALGVAAEASPVVS